MRLAAVILSLVATVTSPFCEDTPQKFLVIVVDGLRPDYITPDVMPALHRLGDSGVFFENHHSAIPTVTRVNSSSFSTGSYPETHGLMGNAVYFPKVNPDKALNTSSYKDLAKIAESEGGRLLTATTLAEVLAKAGKKFVAVSSGSSGSAFLLNSTVAGGGVIHPSLVLPESQREHVMQVVGPAPAESTPAVGVMKWATDAYLKIAREEMDADVAFLWLTDPDHTAHAKGMGSPTTLESLREVDRQIARILEAHESRGLTHRINVLVTSDHGFSTNTGGFDIQAVLKRNNLLDGVHIAEDSIHVDGHDKDHTRKIVEALQREPAVGPIFTAEAAPGDDKGWVPGTLAFTTVRWQHARSADILAFPAWDNEKNGAGIPGRTKYVGIAGHGSTSPWDVHNTLIASGPAFKRMLRINVPSANPDLAPTILSVFGIAPPETMTGRVLRESLVDGPDPASVRVQPVTHHAECRLKNAAGAELTYQCVMHGQMVEGRLYIDRAESVH